jgi:hypothetical protein
MRIRALFICALLLVAGCDDLNTTLRKSDGSNAEIAKLKGQLAQARAALEETTPGRWRIEMRPGVRADTYLVDSGSGRIWRQVQDPLTHEIFWSEMSREDVAIVDKTVRRFRVAIGSSGWESIGSN